MLVDILKKSILISEKSKIDLFLVNVLFDYQIYYLGSSNNMALLHFLPKALNLQIVALPSFKLKNKLKKILAIKHSEKIAKKKIKFKKYEDFFKCFCYVNLIETAI